VDEDVGRADIGIRHRRPGEKTTHPDMKNSRVVPMRPEKGYISLVKCGFLRHPPFSFLPFS